MVDVWQFPMFELRYSSQLGLGRKVIDICLLLLCISCFSGSHADQTALARSRIFVLMQEQAVRVPAEPRCRARDGVHL